MNEVANPPIENDENYMLTADWWTKFIDTNGREIE